MHTLIMPGESANSRIDVCVDLLNRYIQTIHTNIRSFKKKRGEAGCSSGHGALNRQKAGNLENRIIIISGTILIPCRMNYVIMTTRCILTPGKV